MSNTEGFVKVKFYYWHEGVEAERIESMWTTPVNENFKIENIPFYVKEYALGDIISTKMEDGELYADELIEESGNSTIHIVFFNEAIVQQTRDELKKLGCSSELSDKPHLIAVNIPSTIGYQKVIKPFLEKGLNEDLWDYQEACLSSTHSE